MNNKYIDSNIHFNYDTNIKFKVFIYYRQTEGITDGLYIFYGECTLNDFDYIRAQKVNGDYTNDCNVAYRQMMSNLLYKYGKLRPGYELAIVNNRPVYAVNKDLLTNLIDVSSDYSKNFRFEKDLDSYKNHEYLDEVITPGKYLITNDIPEKMPISFGVNNDTRQ